MAMKSLNANSRLAAEQATKASTAMYETDEQYDTSLGLDDLQVRIMKAQAVTDEILKRANRVTDRMFGDSACEAGGEILKSSPYGMLQVLNSQVGELIETLGRLDDEVRRIASL
jgi:hypothetical protein